MLRLLTIYHACRCDGEFQRVCKVQQDVVDNLGCDVHMTEVLLMRVWPPSNIRMALRNTHVVPTSRRIVLPILFPGMVLPPIRWLNSCLRICLGWLLGSVVRPDVVVGETHSAWETIHACTQVRPRATLLLDIHGAVPEEVAFTTPPNRCYASMIAKINQTERQILTHADVILAQSPLMLTHLQYKHGIKPRQAFVYQCGVNTSLFSFSADARARIRAELNIRDEAPVLIYAGGLHKWQMISETLRVFEDTLPLLGPQARLLLLTQDDCRQLPNLFRQPEVALRHLVVRRVTHQEVSGYLSAADMAFLLREDTTLNRVACPTKLGEYLACGLPVITTEISRKWPWWSTAPDCFCVIDPYDTQEAARLICTRLEQMAHHRFRDQCARLAYTALSSELDHTVMREQVAPLLYAKGVGKYAGTAGHK